MPSCLGIYTDKNMIKYAKVTSTPDKISGGQHITVDNYGVKFYDNLKSTFAEIANEVGLAQVPLGLTLSNEDYFITEVFSNLKKKDMMEIITSEYSTKKGDGLGPSSLLERRVKLAQNAGSMDKNLALCVTTTKSELTMLNQSFDSYRIASISPLPISIKNLFSNQAIDEEAAVINIEAKTTVTVFHRGEIQYINSLPLGAYEMINKLAEKYNSTAKAYEALKKVSAYLEDAAFDMDEESRDIIDVVIPVLYDIRQQVLTVLAPYVQDLRKIYITGTGAIINNIDLYFAEDFQDFECEILKPYFVTRDSSNAKDIMEVNSALALALDGVGLIDTEFDFNDAAKKAAGVSSFKSAVDKLKIQDRIAAVKEKTSQIIKRLNSPAKPRRKKKRNVDFDEGLISNTPQQEDTVDLEEDLVGIGLLDSWLLRLATFTVSVFLLYWLGATLTNNYILGRNTEVTREINKVNAAIANAGDDAKYLRTVADDYVAVTAKLNAILEKIKGRTTETFNVPNFLSQLMFIIPTGVQVTSIDVAKTGDVVIQAQSGQYAQLGYFVSNLKIEKALENVDMEVVSENGDIKIIVSGVLP